MLSDLVELITDVVDTTGNGSADGSSSMSSGRQPEAGRTGAGAAGSGAAGGSPDESPASDGGERADDRSGDDPHPDDPDYEEQLQRENAEQTGENVVMELLTSPFRQLGKLLGPLGTVASGSDTLADGVNNVQESKRIREERIHRDTHGYFENQTKPPEQR